MLIDTDVIIWYTRGSDSAKQVVEAHVPFQISVVTQMELVQGMKNKRELNTLKKALRQWETEIIQITPDISRQAALYVEQYYLSHSMQLGDALIAATATIRNLPLLTGNVKHYKVVPSLALTTFRQ